MLTVSLSLVWAALLNTALTAPAVSPPDFVTNFDKLTPTTLGSVKPIPGPQDGLFFGGFTYRSDGVPQIFASSPPNLIGFNNLRKTLGQAAPISNITVRYPGSKVRSYRLISAFVGCGVSTPVTTVPPVGGVSAPPPTIPQPCQISFKGVNVFGKTVSQTCSYSGTSLNPALQSCFFDPTAFANVVTVVVDIVDALTLSETTTVQLDDVAHSNN
ncbi:MAG: hypothetical protein Q9198_002437 [Flavoplaca austrocitrina]